MKIDVKEIEKLKLEEGEVLVINMVGKISEDKYNHIINILKPIFPNNRIIIVDEGTRLSKISPQEQRT